jgi:hypothetical protein
MFVRPGGDDGNDGLTVGSPKATINGAIEDAPLHRDGLSLLTIDVGGGTYPERVLVQEDRSQARIILTGDGTATIDASGLFSALSVRSVAHVEVSGINLVGGTDYLADAQQLGSIQIVDSSHDVNGANRGLYAANMGFVFAESAASITNTASGSEDVVTVIGNAGAILNADMTANGDEGSVVNTAEGARANITGEITGNGATNAIQATNRGVVESANTTLSGTTIGVRAERGFANIKSTVTFDAGISVNIFRIRGGYVFDGGKVDGVAENGDVITEPTTDLSDSGAPAPTESVIVRMHDGTDPGLYRSDPDNSEWVKIEDNSVTIPY